MKGLRAYVLAGLLVFIAGLVITAPARVAVALFAPDNIRISDVSGSVWNGRAGAVLASGVYLRDVQWKLKPMALLTGTAALNLDAALPGGFLTTELELRSENSLSLSELSASLPLALIADAVRTPGLSGEASIRFASLDVENGVPVSATGTVNIARLVVPALGAGNLGGYRLEVTPADDGIVGSLEDTDGVVDIAGSVTLTTDRAYTLLARLEPKRSAPERLKTQIGYLPRTGVGDQREIRLEGSL